MSNYENVTYTVETITPKIAEAYLATSRGNRCIAWNVVEKYAAMMSSGQWGESIDGIAFDRDGHLLNGHHRLNAIVKSGATIRVAVMRGLDSAAMLTIDTGRPRTPANAVEFAIPGIANSRNIASIARYVIGYDEKTGFSPKRMALVSNPEIVQFCRENAGQMDVKITSITKRFKNQLCVFRLIARRKYPEYIVDQFLRLLNDGSRLSNDDPVFALRRAMIGWMCKGHNSQNEMFFRLAVIFKAFRLFVNGKKCKLLRYNSTEEFPVL